MSHSIVITMMTHISNSDILMKMIKDVFESREIQTKTTNKSKVGS